MMNKTEFTKIAKNILNSQKQLKNPQIVHPSREWLIGIFVALVIFGASAAWSLQTYKKYQNTSVNINQQNEVDVVYRESLVNAALEKFVARSQIHTFYIEGYVPEVIVSEEEGEEVATTSPEVIGESSSEVTVSSSAETIDESVSEEVSIESASTTTVEASDVENSAVDFSEPEAPSMLFN